MADISEQLFNHCMVSGHFSPCAFFCSSLLLMSCAKKFTHKIASMDEKREQNLQIQDS